MAVFFYYDAPALLLLGEIKSQMASGQKLLYCTRALFTYISLASSFAWSPESQSFLHIFSSLAAEQCKGRVESDTFAPQKHFSARGEEMGRVNAQNSVASDEMH